MQKTMSPNGWRIKQVVLIIAMITLLFAQPLTINAADKPIEKAPAAANAQPSLDPTQKNLLIAKPAVLQITNLITGELVIQAPAAMELNTPQLAGRTYEFNLAVTGSGFFISPDGYLITNGHVANPDDKLISQFAINQLASTIFKDAVAIVAEASLGYAPPENIVENAYQETLQTTYGGNEQNLADDLYEDFRSGKLKIDNIKRSNYIQVGYAFGSQKKVEQIAKPARLIESPYKGEFDSNDVALMKVEGSNFPTVELGNSTDVQIGKETYVIGYPGMVQELMGTLTDQESQLEPSITKGVISAKKKLVDGTEAFQTDAAVTHGNSGGPAIDNTGKVIGVATWSMSDEPGGQGYNFLISADEVKRLLTRNNVNTATKSLTSDSWSKALTLYSERHFAEALKEFENVKRLSPDLIDTQTYITKSQEAVSQGQDVPTTPIKEKKPEMKIFGQSPILVGIFIALVVLIVINFTKKKPEPPTEPKA